MYVIKVGFRKYLKENIKIGDEFLIKYSKRKTAKRFKTERNAHITAKKLFKSYKLVKVRN